MPKGLASAWAFEARFAGARGGGVVRGEGEAPPLIVRHAFLREGEGAGRIARGGCRRAEVFLRWRQRRGLLEARFALDAEASSDELIVLRKLSPSCALDCDTLRADIAVERIYMV